MAVLSVDEVRALRMRALLLAGEHPHRSVEDVVTWMGAMQAQDEASGMWSLGIRLPGWTSSDVTEALERREALRTWPMRGTVHLVPSRDARWMLDLMSAKPLAGAAKRREYLGITERTVETANGALEQALRGGGRLTRAQCIERIAAAGVETPGQVGYHLLWYASQTGLTCIAPAQGKEQTFVLLDEWVPDPVRLSREESLATIALRYVRSHGPALVKDLSRWTGLGVRDCRAGIDGAGDALASVDTELGPMIAAADALAEGVPNSAGGAVVPPGFDELMLGFGDRTAFVAAGDLDRIVPGGNGVFRATLVREGVVVGTWTRTLRTRLCVVDVEPLSRLTGRDRHAFERAFTRYAAFLGREVDVRWTDRTPTG
ncbi:winged helix DNA-binding domain-containing protein [Demequina sp. NBRC 110053]|uniref:winged helix DNA-binding domain-containing protein n=1 Tax=Demequina sp. NBRC 110053 TaxID=1570342 RepID=UPI0009FDCAC5|nr:winged helix DNA-binding domain-containing protein [Demequina sp. NBRC 110053]